MQWKGRAFYRVAFASDEEIYCGGYDQVPVLYQATKEGEYAEKAVLDDFSAKAKTLGYIEQRASIFEQKKLGQSTEDVEFLQVPKTKHKNAIM